MRNLFAFFYRIRILVLFILLEGIAFTWIGMSRSYQRAALVNSANEFTGGILERTDNLEDYLSLGEQNERLRRENARLRSLTEGAYLPLVAQQGDTIDSLYKHRFRYIEAEVINSSYQKSRNYMTLNRGRVHGIKPEMGVIGSQGVVGKIKDVSPYFSTVIPVISPTFSVSGKIKGTGFFGPLEWSTNNYRTARLLDIPRYADIQPGDTVITDSRSLAFPEGIPIGIVGSYELQEDQNFFAVTLNLTTDFASVEHVYVIKDKLKLELQQIEQQAQQ